MSTTIDNKVVEMRFDNKQFESATAQSMSTIDKLKQKLNFGTSAKSLEGLNTAAKNVNMNGLSGAIDTVHTKFSALQVMGVTALANITNSAVNAGKRMVKSLTITPISTGFQEYELKMGSIQTIMASTGESLETVNKHLNELNEYSDKTIYSFQDMTSNIGKFTNAGVKLEDAVLAMKGISNEAAVSGANANEASRAMYNFAQALSAGYVKLIDWKSIELANMATVEFKEQLIATALEMGTLTKAGDGLYQTLDGKLMSATSNFNESLQDQWMTSEVLISTLKDYASEETVIGKKANEAATQVKTFTQMMDALRESAQSGWAQTWEIIFGDFEQGKTLWTSVNKVLDGIIGRMTDFRNNLLKSALGMGFQDLKKTVDKALGPIDKVVDGAEKVGKSIENVTGTLEDLDTMVNKVIRGDFGNGEERFDKLTESGYNYYRIQNKVNETLDDGYRYTKERIEAQDKLLASQEKVTKETKNIEKSSSKLNKTQKNNIKLLASMTEEQAKANGVTDEQIEALRELKETADKLGLPFEEFIDNLDKINGRWLLLNSFKNIGESLTKIFGAFGNALKDVFGTLKPQTLFDAIAGWHRLTEAMVISDATADKLERTFRGVFAVVDIISRILGGGLRIALTLISSILSAFGATTLDVTASLGDMLYKFDEWLKENDFITKAIEKIAEKLPPIIDRVKEFFDEISTDTNATENFKKIADGLKSIYDVIFGSLYKTLPSFIKVFNAVLGLFGTTFSEVLAKLSEWITKFADWINENTLWMDAVNKTAEIIVALITGITNLAKAFWKLEPVQKLIDNIKKAFKKLKDSIDVDFDFKLGGLQSVLDLINNFFTKITENLDKLGESDTFQNGLDIVEGLANGIIAGIGKAIDAIRNLANSLIESFCGILGINSPSKVFIAIGGFIIAGLIQGLASGEFALFNTVRDLFSALFGNITERLKNNEFDLGAIFVAGGLIAVVYFLKKIQDLLNKLLSPMEGFAKLEGSISKVLDAFSDNLKAKKWTIYAEAIKSVAISLAIMSAALIALSYVDPKKLGMSLLIMAGLIAELVVLLAVASKIDPASFAKMAVMVLSLSVALLIMSSVVKKLSKIDPKKAAAGIIAMTLMFGMIAGLLFVYKKIDWMSLGQFDKAGAMLFKMAVAVGIMALAIRIVGGMSMGDIVKGISILGGMTLILLAFSKIANIAQTDFPSSTGNMFMKMAVAIGIMAIAIRLLGSMSGADAAKGLLIISGFMLILEHMNKASAVANANSSLAGTAFLKFAGAVAILAFAIKTLAGIPAGDVTKGMLIILGLEFIFELYARAASTANKASAQASTGFMAMAAGIAVLAIAMKILAGMKVGDIAKGMVCIAMLEAMFVACGVMLKTVGPNIDKAGILFTKMGTAILILVAAIGLLSILQPESVIRGTACISALSLCFAALVGVTKFAKNTKQMQKTLWQMVAIIGILAAILVGLSFLDPKSVETSAAALSTMMLSFSAALLIMGKTGRISTTLMKNMYALAGVVAILALVLGALAALKVEPSMETASSLSVLLLSFSVALGILGVVGQLPIHAMATGCLGLVMLIGTVAAVLSALVGLNRFFNGGLEKVLDEGIPLLEKIGDALGRFIGGFVGGIGKGITNAMPTMAENLSDFMDKLTGFVDGARNIDGEVVKGVANLTAAVMLLTAANWMDTISRMFTGKSSITAFAEQLPLLGKGIRDFSNMISGIDDDAIKKTKTAIDAIKILAEAQDVMGTDWNKFWTGEGAFSAFANQLPIVGAGLVGFSDSLSSLKNKDLEKTETAIKILEKFTKAESLIGFDWSQFWTGEGTFSAFANQLPSVGLGLVGFANSVKDLSNKTLEKVDTTIKILKKFAEAESLIGFDWTNFWMGEGNFTTFAGQLTDVGKGLVGFANSIESLDEKALEKVDTTIKILKKFAEAESLIGFDWGQFWMGGEGSFSAFASQLPAVGTGLNGFVANIGAFDESHVTTIKCVCDALEAFTKAESLIGFDWTKFWTGEGGFSSFASQLPSVGVGLKGFINAIGTINESAIASVECAVKVVKGIAKLGNSDLSGLSTYLPSVGDNLIAFADDLAAFCKKMADTSTEGVAGKLDGITTSIKESVKKINGQKANFEKAGKNLMSSLLSGIDSKKESIATKFTSAVTKAKDAISKKKEAFTSAGESLGGALVKGIGEKESDAKTAGEDLANKAKSGATAQTIKDSFKSAGKALGDGLINGIEAKESDAYWAGYDLGAAAARGVQDGEDSHSPSRLSYQYGIWLGEGLINGIVKMGKAVYNTGYDLGNTAAESMSNAVSKIANLLETDMDNQPTIRPVLDLSDIRSGVGMMNNMIGLTPSVGVMSNVGAINSMMNRRGQNGANDDVVSAIDKLGKSLGNVGNNTYNVNGINYSEGSDVADALTTIIRAARVERRI